MVEVFVGSVLSALSTGAGALIILFINQSVTHRWMDMLLAFSAGIMMAASTIGLIPEALKLGGFVSLAIGVFLGVLALTTLEKGFLILTWNIIGMEFNLMKRHC